MKKISLILALVLIILVQSCTIKKVKNFTKISIETPGLITVMEGNKDRFVGPKDVSAEVKDGQLEITGGNSEAAMTLFLSEESVKNLECINLKDGGFYSDTLHLSNDNLHICVSGSANFAGFLKTNNVNISLSGDGEMVLSGEGDALTMTMTNYSKYTSPTFEWQNATVNLTDTTKCTIKVLNKLTVNASEAANLGYIGVTDSSFTVTGDAQVFRFPVNVK